MKYIQRLNRPGLRGYNVRFQQARQSRWFGRAAYASWEGARAAAVSYRDRIAKQLNLPLVARARRVRVAQNPTGYPGVYCTAGVIRAEADWGRGGRNCVAFTIKRHGGLEQALRKAVQWRRARERERYGRAFTPLP